MKKFTIALVTLGALILTGCKGHQNNENGNLEEDSLAMAALEGEWILQNVVSDDTLYSAPEDLTSEEVLYAQFSNDSTFGFSTECNSIFGRYTVNGDSISLTEIGSTMMDCENMDIENMLKQILPSVNSVNWTNDSVIVLETDSVSYVVLRKNNI